MTKQELEKRIKELESTPSLTLEDLQEEAKTLSQRHQNAYDEWKRWEGALRYNQMQQEGLRAEKEKDNGGNT